MEENRRRIAKEAQDAYDSGELSPYKEYERKHGLRNIFPVYDLRSKTWYDDITGKELPNFPGTPEANRLLKGF